MKGNYSKLLKFLSNSELLCSPIEVNGTTHMYKQCHSNSVGASWVTAPGAETKGCQQVLYSSGGEQDGAMCGSFRGRDMGMGEEWLPLLHALPGKHGGGGWSAPRSVRR